MERPTDQQKTDTEVALTNWWCGTDFRDIQEDFEQTGSEFTDDAMFGSRLLSEYEAETIELLTWWRGYLGASLHEGTEASVEDFILATHIVMEDNNDTD